jgi:hypothetical protein
VEYGGVERLDDPDDSGGVRVEVFDCVGLARNRDQFRATVEREDLRLVHLLATIHITPEIPASA